MQPEARQVIETSVLVIDRVVASLTSDVIAEHDYEALQFACDRLRSLLVEGSAHNAVIQWIDENVDNLTLRALDGDYDGLTDYESTAVDVVAESNATNWHYAGQHRTVVVGPDLGFRVRVDIAGDQQPEKPCCGDRGTLVLYGRLRCDDGNLTLDECFVENVKIDPWW